MNNNILNDTCFICKREASENNKMCEICADFYIWFIPHEKRFKWPIEKTWGAMAELIKQQREILELENELAIDEGEEPKPLPPHKDLVKELKDDLGLRFRKRFMSVKTH